MRITDLLKKESIELNLSLIHIFYSAGAKRIYADICVAGLLGKHKLGKSAAAHIWQFKPIWLRRRSNCGLIV